MPDKTLYEVAEQMGEELSELVGACTNGDVGHQQCGDKGYYRHSTAALLSFGLEVLSRTDCSASLKYELKSSLTEKGREKDKK